MPNQVHSKAPISAVRAYGDYGFGISTSNAQYELAPVIGAKRANGEDVVLISTHTRDDAWPEPQSRINFPLGIKLNCDGLAKFFDCPAGT